MVSVTKRIETNLKILGTFPASSYTEEQSRRIGQVYDLLLGLADKEEKDKKEKEEAKRNVVHEDMPYEERLKVVY